MDTRLPMTEALSKRQHSWQLVHPQKCNPHLSFGSLKMKRTFKERGGRGEWEIK